MPIRSARWPARSPAPSAAAIPSARTGVSSWRARAASIWRLPASRWPRWPKRSSPPMRRNTARERKPSDGSGKERMRVSWVQPEDVLRHELVQSAAEGKTIDDVAARWVAAGGVLGAPQRGASPEPATETQRVLARALVDELDA